MINLAAWCSHMLGVSLSNEEAEVFVAAALVLLPKPLSAQLSERGNSEELRAALCGLWQQSGRAPHAPAPMPEQPLAPGVVGVFVQELFARLLPAKRRP